MQQIESLQLEEKKLIQIIEEFENYNKGAQAVIFVGDTGSGKSTIVNWLNDAQFELVKNKTFELKLKDQENFSPIGSGNKSITKYPQYKFNEKHQCITIDFPGFKDTRGWQEQLIIKLMFYDIISTPQQRQYENEKYSYRLEISNLRDTIQELEKKIREYNNKYFFTKPFSNV